MQILAYIEAWIGIAGFVWVLFERADKVAKDEARESASRFLRNLEVGKSLNEWPRQFCQVFDTVFGEKHISWRCFLRSAIASLISVILIFILFSIFKENILTGAIVDNSEPTSSERMFRVISFVFVGGALYNILPDYISLLETRFILHKLRNQQSVFQIIFFLSIDIAASIAIFLVPLIITVMTMNIAIEGLESFEETFTFQSILELSSGTIFVKGEIGLLSIFFYSTFFTSIWIYLYVLASSTITFLSKLQKPWLWLRDNFLDIDSKPILAMGWIASMIVTVVFLVSIPFVF